MKIVWHCELNSKTGFSEVSECLLTELHNLGADVYAATGGAWPAPEDDLLKFLIQKHKYGGNLDDAIHVACWFAETYPAMRGRRRYGMGFVESTKARPSLVGAYNQMDGIFTTSNFSKTALLSSGCSAPITQLPPGVRSDFVGYADRPDHGMFSFLTVGVAQIRKNTELVARVFADTFPKSEFPNVRLVMKSSHCGTLDWVKGNGLYDRANFELIWTGPDSGVPNLTPAEMVDLYRRCDCMVHASKGEGGPILEGLATGLPMIFTDWGVLKEFINDDISYPCRVASLERAYSWGYPFSHEDSGEWANIDDRQMATLMRHVVLNRGELEAKGRKAAEYASRLTWKATAQAILSALA